MTNRFAAILSPVLFSLLLGGSILGCGPGAPDTRPHIVINSPLENQVLAGGVGKPVQVDFSVGGTDVPNPDPNSTDTFRLDTSMVKKSNRGHVEAFMNSGNRVAYSITSPITVPDENYAPGTTQLVQAGKLTIELRLFYNDSIPGGTAVDGPASIVHVNIAP